MHRLGELINTREDWLMGQVLHYAKQQGYTRYTSTLKEAWRLSVSGLSTSVIAAINAFDTIPELTPDNTQGNDDPITRFSTVEAKRHKERGISLGMFLGLMKYYRQAYCDLVRSQDLDTDTRNHYELFLNRVFDRIEIGFCVEWCSGTSDQDVTELQINNRLMTNEKNKYLTIFESIPNPVILLNTDKQIDNMNLAAAYLVKESAVPGSLYYHEKKSPCRDTGQPGAEIPGTVRPGASGGQNAADLFPWLMDDINAFFDSNARSVEFERRVRGREPSLLYRVKLAKSLDISDKFDGTIVILEDITSLKQALDEIKTLKGIVPICSHCKQIRDDKGYWNILEAYLQKHSDAEFSHSICPECVRKYYPKLSTDEDEDD